LLTFVAHQLKAQQVVALYKGTIPNSLPNNMIEVTLEWGGRLGGYKSIAQPALMLAPAM
jgi:hypothetical protein